MWQPGAGLGVAATRRIERFEMLGVARGDVLPRARAVSLKRMRYMADAVPSGVLRVVMGVAACDGIVGRVNEPFPGDEANCVLKLISLEDIYSCGVDVNDRKFMLTLWSAADLAEGQFLTVHYGAGYNNTRRRCNYKAGLPASCDVPASRVADGLVRYGDAHRLRLAELASEFGVLDPCLEDPDDDRDRLYRGRVRKRPDVGAHKRSSRPRTRASVAAGCCGGLDGARTHTRACAWASAHVGVHVR